MAATDRRNPNLDDFVGLNWSCWVDKVNVSPSDDNSKYGRKHSETMALRKEDMHIYGHCPAHDEIYLVVCSLCGHVIKPQAFEKHCDRWHGPLNPRCSQSSGLAHQQGPRPGPSFSKLSSSKGTKRNGRYHETSSSCTTSAVHQQRSAKTHKENARNDEMNEKRALTSVGQLRPRTYGRNHKHSDKDKYDLNGLCRVLEPQKKRKSCSQGPINDVKLSPVGRTKVNDQPAVKKLASEEQNVDRHLVRSKVRGQYFQEKSTTGGSKHNSCHHISSRPRDPPQSCPKDQGASTVEVEVQLPYPFNQSLLSREQAEDDKDQDLSWHPKPLGLCTFGCRTLGCNIFTFDRRWQHLQFALSAMLEQHVSTHV